VKRAQPRWPRALLLLATACASLPHPLWEGEGAPRRLEGLAVRTVLDREDFNYALAVSRDGRAPGRWLLDGDSPLSFTRGGEPLPAAPSVHLPPPWAPARARVREGAVLSLGGWRTPPLSLVACERCMPEGLDGVLGAAAWTPQNAVGNRASDPAAEWGQLELMVPSAPETRP